MKNKIILTIGLLLSQYIHVNAQSLTYDLEDILPPFLLISVIFSLSLSASISAVIKYYKTSKEYYTYILAMLIFLTLLLGLALFWLSASIFVKYL